MGKDLKGKDLGKGFSQRKDGRYEARAVINGVKIDIYDMKLSKLRKEFELKKASVLRNEQPQKENMTLEEWYKIWFEKCKAPTLKSESSIKTYNRKCYNTFISILGSKRIDLVSQLNIQDATNELSDKYNERTIREALGVLRECLEIAIVNNLINANPCTGIKIKNANIKKERRVLTIEEQEIFIKEVEGTYYEEAYKILLCTGMRIGEFSGLQWEDIDWHNKCININRSMQTAYFDGKKVEELTTPKTLNSYRSIPFFNETERLLKSWKKKQDMYKSNLGDRWRAREELGNLVFTSTMGSPVTRYVITHDIKRIENNINLKEINKAIIEGRTPDTIKHIHPHAFRHTFATRCFEKGLDPLFVQSIMGHSNYSTTLSYTHLLDDMKKKELNKLSGDFLN